MTSHGEAETGLLALAAAGLCGAAANGLRGDAWAWLALVAVGLVLEGFAVELAHTHEHRVLTGQWRVLGPAPWLPSKELLWYGLALWPGWAVTRAQGFRGPAGAGASMALLSLAATLPYDLLGSSGGCGGRNGDALRWWDLNRSFALAGLDGCRGVPGIAAVAFSWLCTGACLGAALHWAETRQRGPVALLAALLAALSPTALLWAPFHAAKALGCLLARDAAWYPGPAGWLEAHSRCVRASPVADLAVLLAAGRDPDAPAARRARDAARAAALPSSAGYHSLLALLASKWDEQGALKAVVLPWCACAVLLQAAALRRRPADRVKRD